LVVKYFISNIQNARQTFNRKQNLLDELGELLGSDLSALRIWSKRRTDFTGVYGTAEPSNDFPTAGSKEKVIKSKRLEFIYQDKQRFK